MYLSLSLSLSLPLSTLRFVNWQVVESAVHIILHVRIIFTYNITIFVFTTQLENVSNILHLGKFNLEAKIHGVFISGTSR